MSEIRKKLLGLLINSDMSEPHPRESFLKFQQLLKDHDKKKVEEEIGKFLRNPAYEANHNPFMYAIKQKLSKIANYEKDYDQAYRILNNLFLLQQRENIKVDNFIPFMNEVIFINPLPLPIWHDVATYSKDQLKGNPICIAEFINSLQSVYMRQQTGESGDKNNNYHLFLSFNIINNHEAQSLAYKTFCVQQEIPIAEAQVFAVLNYHRTELIFEQLKFICADLKITPEQLFEKVEMISKVSNADNAKLQQDKRLAHVLSGGGKDISFSLVNMQAKPSWFDEALLSFYTMATVWCSIKKKGL